MSKKTNFKVKSQAPLSVIMHGGNYLGFLLAETLLEQGSQVIVIDKFTSKSKKYTNQLKKSGDITFINRKSAKSFLEDLSRIDYLYYDLNSKLEEEENLESKDFLAETDTLNLALKSAQKFKAKISLLSSLRLNRELADRVNNDNLAQPSPYSNIELQKYCENLAAEFRDKTKANLRIIRLGTILGKGIENITDPKLHKLLLDGVNKHQIEIIGEGLDIHNIIEESDAVYGILKLTFSDKTKGEVISLANKTDYTTLSMAYKLLELNVTAQTIKFVTDSESKLVLQDLYVPAPNASKYGWKQQSTLENTLIDQIHKYYESTNQKWEIEKQVIDEKKIESKEVVTKKGEFFSKILSVFSFSSKKPLFTEINYGKVFLFTTLAILTVLIINFFLSPLIGIGISTFIIKSSAQDIQENIRKYEFSSAQKDFDKIENNFKKIRSNYQKLSWFFTLSNKENLSTEIDKMFLGLEYALDGGGSLLEGLEPLILYVKDFEPAINFDNNSTLTTREYREHLQSIEMNSYLVKDGAYKVNLANEVISTVVIQYFPEFLQEHVLEAKIMTERLNTSVIAIDSMVDFLPDLLGYSERKRYLILLQNEGEIRGTGGWLSSYAIVGLEGGQIRELFIDDIYNADGTLKVQNKRFPPPKSMMNALEMTEYPFSLINWNPDLYSVMLEAETFISALGKGSKIDGIITINISFIQKLLEEWGGIEVPGESELITSDNIYIKIFEIHEDFTPGSDRKSTFLANLANQIVTKLLSSDFKDYQEIVSILTESLDEKGLQVVFKNTDAKSFFVERNWDGQLSSKNISAPVAIDWNWGANKANLYIKRSHTLDVEVTEHEITYRYEINVVNESTQNIYPQGDYINYIRIYIPNGSTILNIEGIENNEYDIYNEQGFKVVGGWFNTNAGGDNTLVLRYKINKNALGINFPLKTHANSIFFDLNIRKQSGTRREGYVLNVSFPEDWNILESSELTAISNQLSRRFDLISDTEFNMSWTIL